MPRCSGWRCSPSPCSAADQATQRWHGTVAPEGLPTEGNEPTGTKVPEQTQGPTGEGGVVGPRAIHVPDRRSRAECEIQLGREQSRWICPPQRAVHKGVTATLQERFDSTELG